MRQKNIIHVKAFDMARSSGLLDEYRDDKVTRGQSDDADDSFSGVPIAPPPPYDDTKAEAIMGYRLWSDVDFYPRAIARLKKRYPVTIKHREIAGVYTEVISPKEGVSETNGERVLINLHAGGFTFGARLCGQLESIPIANLGKIDVISIDYRLAPEHRHPAAVEDVVAVYKELLKTYEPKNIGIFGYSAGALLTAQAIYRLLEQKLPVPGAIGLLFGGATYWGKGDSAQWACAILARTIPDWKDHLYLQDVEDKDATAFPLNSLKAIAQFPPSLLVSSGRDVALSSIIHTHSCLTAEGVQTQLNIWEGLNHAFSLDYRIPQSAEVFATVVRFFENHLGKQGMA